MGAGASLARISTRGGLQQDTGRFVCTQNPLMTNYLLETGEGPHLKAAMTVSRSYRAWYAPSCRAAARPYPHTNRTISRDGGARGRRRRLSQSDTSAFGPRSLQGPRDRRLLVVTARAAPRRLEQCDKLTVRIEIGWCSHQVARFDQSVLSRGGISRSLGSCSRHGGIRVQGTGHARRWSNWRTGSLSNLDHCVIRHRTP